MNAGSTMGSDKGKSLKNRPDASGTHVVFRPLSAILMGVRRAMPMYPAASPPEEATEILRRYWSPLAVCGNFYDENTEKQEVQEEDLLAGELEAVTFQIGTYMVRSALRAYCYWLAQPKFDRIPANPDEVAQAREAWKKGLFDTDRMDFLQEKEEIKPQQGSIMRVVQEISARHSSKKDGQFTLIFRWHEHQWEWDQNFQRRWIFCTAKKTPLLPNGKSVLLLCAPQVEMFSSSDWFILDANQNVSHLHLNPVATLCDHKRFSPIPEEKR